MATEVGLQIYIKKKRLLSSLIPFHTFIKGYRSLCTASLLSASKQAIILFYSNIQDKLLMLDFPEILS